MEDDIHFTDKTLQFLQELEKNLVNRENIIVSLKCVGSFCDGKNSDIPKLINPNFPLGSGAYILTKNTAKKLYEDFGKHKINYHVAT